MRGAHPELIGVAGKLKAPIVHAMRGKEFIEYNNPFDVGMTGLLGFSSGYQAMMDAKHSPDARDGSPLPAVLPGRCYCRADRYPRRTDRGRRTAVDVGLIGDVKTTLTLVSPKLSEKTDDKQPV